MGLDELLRKETVKVAGLPSKKPAERRKRKVKPVENEKEEPVIIKASLTEIDACGFFGKALLLFGFCQIVIGAYLYSMHIPDSVGMKYGAWWCGMFCLLPGYAGILTRYGETLTFNQQRDAGILATVSAFGSLLLHGFAGVLCDCRPTTAPPPMDDVARLSCALIVLNTILSASMIVSAGYFSAIPKERGNWRNG
jgi:hypothetical protein